MISVKESNALLVDQIIIAGRHIHFKRVVVFIYLKRIISTCVTSNEASGFIVIK